MKPFANSPGPYPKRQTRSDVYEEFDATELYCPKCKQAVPVRKRLLLVLPQGDKYEYLCAYCSETVGTKIDKQTAPLTILS
jgi:DNA-directed RNA polymerase subunit RPC12/RpoP